MAVLMKKFCNPVIFNPKPRSVLKVVSLKTTPQKIKPNLVNNYIFT